MTEAEWLTTTDLQAMWIYLGGEGATIDPLSLLDHYREALGILVNVADRQSDKITPRQLRSFAEETCQVWKNQALDVESTQLLDCLHLYLLDQTDETYRILGDSSVKFRETHKNNGGFYLPLFVGDATMTTPRGVSHFAQILLWTSAYMVHLDEIHQRKQPKPSDPVCTLTNRLIDCDYCDFDGWLQTVAHGNRILANNLRDIVGNPFRPVAFTPHWCTINVLELARTIYDERAFERLPILADALMDAGCDDEQIIGHCRSNGPHVRGCWLLDMILGKSLTNEGAQ